MTAHKTQKLLTAKPEDQHIVLEKDETDSLSTTVFSPTDTFYLIADADGTENTHAKAT